MTTPTESKRRRLEPPPPPNLTTSGLSICRNCNLVFRNATALNQHSKTENHKMVLDGLRPPFGAFFCLLCWVGFKSMDELRTHYNREIHENNTFRAGVKAIWTGASNSSTESNLAAELPSNVSPISLSPDRAGSLSPISLEEGDEVLPTTTTSTSRGPSSLDRSPSRHKSVSPLLNKSTSRAEVSSSTTNKHLNGRQTVIQNIVRKNDRQPAKSTIRPNSTSQYDSPKFHHRSKENGIDRFVILDEVGDEQVGDEQVGDEQIPPASDRLDDMDDISLSEEEDNLEKVSSDEEENDDTHSFENISSPEHVTNASEAKLDFENVDSPEEHVEQHEDLEAVDSPEEDPDDAPSDFRRGLEQSLEAVSSPEPENEAETNASTPEVKDQSDSSNLDDDLLLMDQHLELIYD